MGYVYIEKNGKTKMKFRRGWVKELRHSETKAFQTNTAIFIVAGVVGWTGRTS